jgi:methionyl-tRNA formyltransferase
VLRIVYAGTPEFAVPALAALARTHTVVAVYTQPDRPAGRGRALAQSPVKQRALELGLPVEQPATLKTPDAAATLAAYAPDAMVVAAYGLLLPQAVLDVPRLGCINIHASTLPRWRGAAPIQRAILAGDAATGVCIMRMEAGLDTGPVYLHESVAIGARETAGQLHDRLAALGARLVVDALDALEAGTARAVPQPTDDVTYAHKLDKREAAIDWRRPAVELERAVRAFVPWPIAETRLAGEQLRVHEAIVAAPAAPAVGGEAAARDAAVVAGKAAAPGTILAASADGLDVATGDGVLRLLRLQLAGRRPVSAREFLNAGGRAGTLVGTRLGEAAP